MRRLSREEFHAELTEYDACVARCSGVDPFCSSSAWILAADEALSPGRTPFLFRGEHGYTVCALRTNEQGTRIVEALEAMWGLSSPVVGKEPASAAREFCDNLRQHEALWDGVLLTGLLAGQPLLGAVVRELMGFCEVRVGQPTPRYVLDLQGGVEGVLQRRSRNLRRALRKAERRAHKAGLHFEIAHATSSAAADEVFERLQAVEGKSWKGLSGVGISDGRMSEFYHVMGRYLAERRQHRCMFARLGDRDVGYILGGQNQATYRGLQFSYDDECAELSVGNLMQLAQMRELVAAGVDRYDLGSEAHYKERWADRNVNSPVLFAVKH